LDNGHAQEEERIRREQESDFMQLIDVSPGPYQWAHGKVQWLEAEEGITVRAVELRGTYPDTRLVVVFTVFRDEAYRDCTFRWYTRIWLQDGRLRDFDLLGMRFVEFLAKKLRRYRGCEPGSTLDVGGVMPPSEYWQ
jgi:hypothetical protein